MCRGISFILLYLSLSPPKVFFALSLEFNKIKQFFKSHFNFILRFENVDLT